MDKYLNKIIQGDCLDILKTLPSESVDCVVTSPPYNVGKNNMTENKYGGGDAMNQEDYFEWLKSIIDELLRVTKNHIFFNIQMLSDNKRGVLKLLGEYNEKIKDIIIWDKTQVAPAIEGGVMNSKFEFVIIFSNDFPEKRKFTCGNFHGNFNNVITGKSASNENKWSEKHKAIFPLYLPETIIAKFTKPMDIILDPFIGLGTTAVAAKNHNRNYIGIELNPDYIEIANGRLSQDLLF